MLNTTTATIMSATIGVVIGSLITYFFFGLFDTTENTPTSEETDYFLWMISRSYEE